MHKIPVRLKKKVVDLEIDSEYILDKDCLSYVICTFADNTIKTKYYAEVESALKESKLNTKLFVCITFGIILNKQLVNNCKEYRLLGEDKIINKIVQHPRGYYPEDDKKYLIIDLKAFQFSGMDLISCKLSYSDFLSKKNIPQELEFDNYSKRNDIWSRVQLKDANIIQQLFFLFHFFDKNTLRHNSFVTLTDFIPYYDLQRNEILLENDSIEDNGTLKIFLAKFFEEPI
jgi:hypothetical protein